MWILFENLLRFFHFHHLVNERSFSVLLLFYLLFSFSDVSQNIVPDLLFAFFWKFFVVRFHLLQFFSFLNLEVELSFKFSFLIFHEFFLLMSFNLLLIISFFAVFLHYSHFFFHVFLLFFCYRPFLLLSFQLFLMLKFPFLLNFRLLYFSLPLKFI